MAYFFTIRAFLATVENWTLKRNTEMQTANGILMSIKFELQT